MSRKNQEMRVGDDGLFMTKTRIFMHRILNVALVWGVISLLSTLIFAALAYAQGQTFVSWELIAQGGNTYCGYYTADLLRIEAGVCFAIGVLLVVAHQAGFMWFYERRSMLVFIIASVLIELIVIVWQCFLLSIRLIDPLGLISFVIVAILLMSNYRVEKERKNTDLTV